MKRVYSAAPRPVGFHAPPGETTNVLMSETFSMSASQASEEKRARLGSDCTVRAQLVDLLTAVSWHATCALRAGPRGSAPLSAYRASTLSRGPSWCCTV